MRLLGNIEAKTDSKGRVFLPAAFRKVLQGEDAESLVLRKDVYQDCLTLYPQSSWNMVMDGVRSRINRWNPRHLQIYRQFLSDVEIVYPDSSGRILIPKRLLEAAGLEQGIRFIGMGDYIEMWSSAATSHPFIEQDDFMQEMEKLMADPPVSGETDPNKEILHG
jgi:MraZ protein